MKIPQPLNARFRSNGSATIIFTALLAIMVILVTAESRSLAHLRREVKFLEQQQIKRLNHSQTNTIAPVLPESK
jgi:hypothetical protein